jgi:hypothetical protein
MPAGERSEPLEPLASRGNSTASACTRTGDGIQACHQQATLKHRVHFRMTSPKYMASHTDSAVQRPAWDSSPAGQPPRVADCDHVQRGLVGASLGKCTTSGLQRNSSKPGVKGARGGHASPQLQLRSRVNSHQKGARRLIHRSAERTESSDDHVSANSQEATSASERSSSRFCEPVCRSMSADLAESVMMPHQSVSTHPAGSMSRVGDSGYVVDWQLVGQKHAYTKPVACRLYCNGIEP